MKKFLKITGLLFVIFVVIGMFMPKSETTESAPTETTSTEAAPATEEKTIDGTVAQLNALGKAKNYLMTAPFSAKGLMKQLEFEGFNTEDSTFAIENVGADWNEQAVIASKNYLNTAPFSAKGLVKQLEFEGYTSEQAKHGVSNIEVDWNEQATRAAKNYLDTSSFSKKELIGQLEFEGYSKEQAKFGVEQTGL